jgi:AraC-like DNA-binding protein
MIFATHVPRPPLNQFIEFFWFHEGFNADHRLERVIPDGSMELIINLRDEKRHVFDPISHQPRETYRRSWLSGPHSEFIVIDTAPNASMIGVHLRPGGASAFFGLPLSELRNSVVELDTLWNGEAQNLRDQLLEAPSPSGKFRILEDTLLARWRGFAPRHRAVPWTDIATGCGYYDQAHFINDFREFCGITPGDYAGESPEYPNFVPIRD